MLSHLEGVLLAALTGELRVAANGVAYSRAAFLQHYGRLDEWHAAAAPSEWHAAAAPTSSWLRPRHLRPEELKRLHEWRERKVERQAFYEERERRQAVETATRLLESVGARR